MKTAFADSLIKYWELLAGITGLVCYFKRRNSIWFVFAVFLVCLFGMESAGKWLGRHQMVAANTRLYKWLVIPAIFLIYHWLYYHFSSKKTRPFVLASALIFVVLALSENIFLGRQHYYSISVTLGYGCTAILLLSFNYFAWLLKEGPILQFQQSMPFWFCAGLLVFYLGSFPYLVLFNSLGFSVSKTAYWLFRWLFIILNYVMYLFFTIGFIWSRPK